MKQMSTKEAAEKWGISIRTVQRFLKADRIPGAKKYSGAWFIPENSKKPFDLRKEKGISKEPAYTFFGVAPMSKEKGRKVNIEADEELHMLIEADIDYRRGNVEPAIECWRIIPTNSPIKIQAGTLAIAAAISGGNYGLYFEIQRFMKEKSEETDDPKQLAILSLPEVLVSVSMGAAELTPNWLRICDFAYYENELYPFLLFLHGMYLRNTKDYHGLLAMTRSFRVLCNDDKSFSWIDIYLLILSALANYQLGEIHEARKILLEAMDLGLPHGFVLPFADYIGHFGGLIEACIEQKWPQYKNTINDLWEESFKNWMKFRNHFVNDNITTILTAQEYEIAHLLCCKMTYVEIARQMHISIGRLKNIIQEIYGKLYVNKRNQLSEYVL